MKVLVISNYNAKHTVRPEAEIFIDLHQLGVEVEIMTYEGSYYAKKFKENGIRVIDFHPEKKFSRKESDFIRKHLKEGRHDILHLFNSKSTITGIRAAKSLPVKVVLYRGYEGNIKWYDPTCYLKYLHPRVDKIVCNAKSIENYINKQFKFQKNKNKAITINKGHDVDWYKTKPISRKELGISENALLLVNSANNRKMKGIPWLLEAMNQIPGNCNIHLLLLGRNMETKENLHILNKGKNVEKVHFLGFRKDALSVVAACDAFVLPSIMGESLTKAVVEAMSLSVAPIITDIPGNAELLVNGISGLVVPAKNSEAIKNAILMLYHDRELCESFGNQAKQHIKTQLNHEKTVKEMKKLYEELLQESKE